MPKRGSIAKRQRPYKPPKKRPAILQKTEGDTGKEIVSAKVSVGERQLQFARALADTEQQVREASLISLQTWLEENSAALSDVEIARLWKALFYCIWMADKRHIISSVIKNIVDFTDIVGWQFLRGLLDGVTREWSGIDRHRVDKFYELLTVALEKSVSIIVSAGSAEQLTASLDKLLECIAEGPLKSANREGKGVVMHILDKWSEAVMLPVLEKASSFSLEHSHCVWDSLIEKFLPLLRSRDGHLSAVKHRLENDVLEKVPSIIQTEGLNLEASARYSMLERTSNTIFAIASSAGTLADDRKKLYELRTDFKSVLLSMGKAIELAKENSTGEGASPS